VFLFVVRNLFRLLCSTRKIPKKNKQQWLNPSSHSVAMELTQPLTETRDSIYILWLVHCSLYLDKMDSE
jgi:hypothetical protein